MNDDMEKENLGSNNYNNQNEAEGKWWKSWNKYPTTKEIVEYLRSRGELDEEVLKRFNRDKYDLIIACIIANLPIIYWLTFNMRLANIISAFLLSVTLILINYIHYKIFQKQLYIYTYGKITKATITRGIRFNYSWQIKYTFYIDSELFNPEGTSQVFPIKDSKGTFENGLPRKGDIIEILYLENDPGINCVWLKRLNQKRNIRKEK